MSTEFLEMKNLSKFYGNIIALTGVTTTVNPGEVTCILGDNGAGKSTFIKILAGVHQHDEGDLLLEGEAKKFASPREALAHGIATVYQDLAMVPLMVGVAELLPRPGAEEGACGRSARSTSTRPR